jgi:hypothetical protein
LQVRKRIAGKNDTTSYKTLFSLGMGLVGISTELPEFRKRFEFIRARLEKDWKRCEFDGSEMGSI